MDVAVASADGFVVGFLDVDVFGSGGSLSTDLQDAGHQLCHELRVDFSRIVSKEKYSARLRKEDPRSYSCMKRANAAIAWPSQYACGESVCTMKP